MRLEHYFAGTVVCGLFAGSIAIGCDGKQERPVLPEADAGAGASMDGGEVDDAGGGDATCALAGGQCVSGGAGCCGAIAAYRFDSARNCRESALTVLECVGSPKRSGQGCKMAFGDEASCIYRQADAGAEADAGFEVYVSDVYIDVPGFRHCDGTLPVNPAPTGTPVCP